MTRSSRPASSNSFLFDEEAPRTALELANAHAHEAGPRGGVSRGAGTESWEEPPGELLPDDTGGDFVDGARASRKLDQMHHKRAVGDFSGALAIADAILHDEPGDDAALRTKDACESALLQMYRARVGALERVPRVAVPADQLRSLAIDHRTGFVLSHVDGYSTLETILDVSGMRAFEAFRILDRLVTDGIIAL